MSKYEYYIYGGLSLLFVTSEALGMIKSVKANSLIDIVWFIVEFLTTDSIRREENTPAPVTPLATALPPTGRTKSVIRENPLFKSEATNEFAV
jgi:hypothetical protein